ncbi:MAG: DUF427 domain-containing protein [Streptosporangiales bacterium]|nr:DUF427 domain-containing protein [Streptosporangiales bacterium]
MDRVVKIPDETHPITVRPAGGHVTVRVGGTVVAETDRALSLSEASYPVIQYIPLADLDPALLTPTRTHTYCPFKGEASYYTVTTPDGRAETDLAWYYTEPYDAVAEIAGHAAFYPGRAEVTVS